MSSLGLVGGTIGAALLLVAWGVLVDTAIPASDGGDHISFDTTTVSAPFAAGETNRDETADERLLDRYGNEVERAVSDYRIDYRGDIYERHSPQTAVPRLKAPIG